MEDVTFVDASTLLRGNDIQALDNAINRNAGQIAVLQTVMGWAPVQTCGSVALKCTTTVEALGLQETKGFISCNGYIAGIIAPNRTGIIAPNRTLTVFYLTTG